MSEQIVLGGIIADNEKMFEVNTLITSESFTNPRLANLFRHLQQFHYDSEPFDLISIQEKLGESWYAPCAEMISKAFKHGNIIHHAGLIREKHLREGVKIALGKAMEKLIDRSDTQSVIDELSTFISLFDGVKKGQLRNIRDSLPELLDELNERAEAESEIIGLTTGIPELDLATQGLQDADLIVIGGRPSSGKTALALNIAAHNAFECEKTVLVFSIEMPERKIQQRLLTSTSQVDYKSIQNATCIQNAQSFSALGESISKIKKGKFIVNDTSTLSTAQLKSEAIRYKHKHGEIGLIVVDYVQLLTSKAENRFQEVSQISRDLKSTAKLLDCPLVAISQLNRGLESRDNKRPIMPDLRESGQLEQDADIIAFIYRDEVYDELSPAKGLAEINIAKGRDCGLSNIVAKWAGNTQTFSSASPYDYEIINKLKTATKENGSGNSNFQNMYSKGFKGKGAS